VAKECGDRKTLGFVDCKIADTNDTMAEARKYCTPPAP
jgi:hypothetical protein